VFPMRYGLYLYVPHGSHNKQRLFPQTALTGWALQWRRNVFPVRYGLYLCVPYGSHSKERLFPQITLTGWSFSGEVMCFV
jgi:hypothetical protein